MKKFNLLVAFVLCMFVLSTTSFAIGDRKEFKNYEITSVGDVNLGKDVKAIWNLKYNHGEKTITVLKHKAKDGTEYVVRSKFFEVSYAATPNGFGARTVKRSLSTVPAQINEVVINKEQLQRQAVISASQVDDETALSLIAAFLPDLINDEYTHVLN